MTEDQTGDDKNMFVIGEQGDDNGNVFVSGNQVDDKGNIFVPAGIKLMISEACS